MIGMIYGNMTQPKVLEKEETSRELVRDVKNAGGSSYASNEGIQYKMLLHFSLDPLTPGFYYVLVLV